MIHFVSYETYRNVFNKKFNVSFGYPRSDTCSTCNVHTNKCIELTTKIKNLANGDEKSKAETELRQMEVLKKCNLKQAEKCNSRKKLCRENARRNKNMSVLCMDFQRNLDLPHIITNDAYYRRKSAYNMFNIHEIAIKDSIFYSYTEIVGGKGSNEVVSFLDNYINLILDKEVKELFIFCD